MYFCSKVLQSEDNRFDPYNILWVTSPSIKCHELFVKYSPKQNIILHKLINAINILCGTVFINICAMTILLYSKLLQIMMSSTG